jgi:cytochrome oxidase Cu insertion factor (SCO1/SenC/PrrC family)
VSPRTKLALIVAACAAPFVLGTAAYYFRWTPGGQANYGELIAPRPLAGPPFDELRGKWVLVSFDAAACDAYCEKKLYFMRQVRTAQHKNMGRVERLWLLTDTGKPRAELIAAIEGTRIAAQKDSAAAKQFPGNITDHIYVVDPNGNLMMRFPRDPDPSKLLKDLERLLRLSQIG